jgi:hypothetical protein
VKSREYRTSTRTEAVVDAAEAVEVDEDQGDRLTGPLVAPALLFQPRQEVATVVALGQRVPDRERLQAGVADRDRSLGGEGTDQPLVLGIERDDGTVPVEGVDELQDPEKLARRVGQRHDEDRPGPVVQPGVHPAVEAVWPVRRDHVGVVEVQDVAGPGHVAGQARLAQPEGLCLQGPPHLVLP